MTMILALANRENVIQLSDRRLTTQGTVVEEEHGKSGTLFCGNARFAFGFTGIAQIAEIKIRRWILETLLESGPPDYSGYNVLERFKEQATTFFKSHQVLRNLPPFRKRLSIMFSGYLHMHHPPMIGNAIISNFQNPSQNISTPGAWDEFAASYFSEKKPRHDAISMVQIVGAWRAMTEDDVNSLRPLLETRKPAKGIIDKAVNILLQMAERPGAVGTIGKQITWIRIPSDTSQELESGYYSNVPTHAVFMPSAVIITSQENRFCYDEPSVSAVDPATTPPMAVPEVHRNAPCPCGSGKKYRLCHGRKTNKGN